ncbi:regulatory protein RecX [Salinibacterium sp. ZJ450]|uniref:regulatory protein RecX n=1 Tax=Salinibacterium sp. ZJ450 TaxID=2708338 RepID=UPI00141E0A70|nr:regulatory protein RecX [Salinibacterium sp. ZJ450]
MDDDGLAPVIWLRPAGARPSSPDPDEPRQDGADAQPAGGPERPIPFPRAHIDESDSNAGASHTSAGSAGPGDTRAGSAGWDDTGTGNRGWDDTDSSETDSDDTPALDQAQIEKISLGALTRRGVSSREMQRVLVRRGVEPEAADAEVERLERVGLLDDTALAETLVRTLRDRKGLGKSALKAELGRRLIDSVAIEAALDETDADDEAARALEVAMKRAPQLRSLEREVAVRRLTAFLMRKGYSGGVVRSAVDTALGGYRPRGNPSSVRFE